MQTMIVTSSKSHVIVDIILEEPPKEGDKTTELDSEVESVAATWDP